MMPPSGAGLRASVRACVRATCLALLTLSPLRVAAQDEVPVRPLPPPEALSTIRFGPNASVRGLSDGRVIVHTGDAMRIQLLDQRHRLERTLLDSAEIWPERIRDVLPSFRLLPLTADTTAFMDIASERLLILDRNGTIVARVQHPVAEDIWPLTGRSWVGTPRVDARGRIVYLGRAVRGAPSSAAYPWIDSVPLVRWDRVTGAMDTIVRLRADRVIRTTGGGAQPRRTVLNPVPLLDAWVMMADGTIAVLRVADRRVDWHAGEGRVRQSPLPLAPGAPLTREAYQLHRDSMEAWAAWRGAEWYLRRGLEPEREEDPPDAAPFEEMPPRFAAFHPRAVFGDEDGYVWIAGGAEAGGRVYEVLGRDGRIVERWRAPANLSIVGTGPGRAIYLLEDGGSGLLRRVRLPR